MTKLITDMNDLTDIEESISVLTARRAVLLAGLPVTPETPEPSAPVPPVPPAGPVPTAAALRMAVRSSLEGYGRVRLPLARAVAEASPGVLPKADAYALLRVARPECSPAQVMGGLHSSLERGWLTKTGGVYGMWMTSRSGGFHQELETATIVLEILDEMGA